MEMISVWGFTKPPERILPRRVNESFEIPRGVSRSDQRALLIWALFFGPSMNSKTLFRVMFTHIRSDWDLVCISPEIKKPYFLPPASTLDASFNFSLNPSNADLESFVNVAKHFLDPERSEDRILSITEPTRGVSYSLIGGKRQEVSNFFDIDNGINFQYTTRRLHTLIPGQRPLGWNKYQKVGAALIEAYI